GQAFTNKPKSHLTLSKINSETTPGDDALAASGSFALPAGHTFADLNPATDGVRVVVATDDGTKRLDATIPGGLYNPATRVGWKRSGNGKMWRFIDQSATPVGGIIKVVIVDQNGPRTPNRVKVGVNGRRGTYPVVASDVPVQLIVTLGDASAAADGLCG